MLLLAAGVKKSLIFNNVLNAINLAVWVFVMTAGLFYVNTDNWTKHDGFLPKGWSGVSWGSFRLELQPSLIKVSREKMAKFLLRLACYIIALMKSPRKYSASFAAEGGKTGSAV